MPLLEVLDSVVLIPNFNIFLACMYLDFYKMYVMIYSDLHASRADLELYGTDASMHLVSHFDYGMH